MANHKNMGLFQWEKIWYNSNRFEYNTNELPMKRKDNYGTRK
jgi:hypothetical protein